MLKRVDWNMLLGAFFLVIGVLLLLDGSTVDGAWCMVLGAGNLWVAYGHRHPDAVTGVRGWVIVIPWIVVLAVLTFLRFRG